MYEYNPAEPPTTDDPGILKVIGSLYMQRVKDEEGKDHCVSVDSTSDDITVMLHRGDGSVQCSSLHRDDGAVKSVSVFREDGSLATVSVHDERGVIQSISTHDDAGSMSAFIALDSDKRDMELLKISSGPPRRIDMVCDDTVQYNRRGHMRRITRAQISALVHLSQTQAARTLQMSIATLRVICRKLKVYRWNRSGRFMPGREKVKCELLIAEPPDCLFEKGVEGDIFLHALDDKLFLDGIKTRDGDWTTGCEEFWDKALRRFMGKKLFEQCLNEYQEKKKKIRMLKSKTSVDRACEN